MKMQDKTSIRREMLAARKELDDQVVASLSARIAKRIDLLPEFEAARVVCCYLAMRAEVDLGSRMDAAWKAAKRLCVPAYRHDRGGYEPAWYEGNMRLSTGPDGARQPAVPEWVPPGEIDVILVPGLAFDSAGGRLGRGGGHYDWMLRRMGGHPFKLGVAFDFQLVDRVPVDRSDVSMDAVVTENKTLRCAAAHPDRRRT